jgi:uncharacterized membrane protein
MATIEALAYKLRITPDSVRRRARRAGVSIHEGKIDPQDVPAVLAEKRGRKPLDKTAAMEAFIIKHGGRMSDVELAKILGISRQRVGQLRKGLQR